MKTVAVMPIKIKSERCPGKNTRLLCGKPLLRYELENLIETKMCDSINVYCSSKEIIKYLPQGISFLKRPEELDSPTSNFTQIFKSFSERIDADIYIYAHATAPLITKETMMECIAAVQSGSYDSAFCAVKIQDYLWKCGKPMNFNAQNIPRTQDIEPIYKETSGIYVFTKEVFDKYQSRVGKMPFIKEVNYKEAVNIDTINDFILAEALFDVDFENNTGLFCRRF